MAPLAPIPIPYDRQLAQAAAMADYIQVPRAGDWFERLTEHEGQPFYLVAVFDSADHSVVGACVNSYRLHGFKTGIVDNGFCQLGLYVRRAAPGEVV